MSFDVVTYALCKSYTNREIAKVLPGTLDTWAQIQAAIRGGRVDKYLSAGDQLTVTHAYTVSATSTGVTSPTVNKDTFAEELEYKAGTYVFGYDGTSWRIDDRTVDLTDYGITYSGTAASGNTITVVLSATNSDWNVLGIDEDIPVSTAAKHVVTIQKESFLMRKLFDPEQYLFAVTEEACEHFGWDPEVGMPAGNYSVTLDHGSRVDTTGEDGTYYFTTTVAVPVGGGVRHTKMGEYVAGDAYTVSHITGGVFRTYKADTITALESSLTTQTVDPGSAVSLGTASGSNPRYRVGDFINFTQRQYYGSNRWSTSWIRQYLNSDEAVFQWTPKTIWSRNVSGTVEGFIHTLDPELQKCLGKVRKRYALDISDGYGYEDCEDTVTLATMLDVFGSKNNNIDEGPVDAGGTVKRTTAYSYWATRNTDADRIKGDTVNYYWWLSSVYPSVGCIVRLVYTSGALNDGGACYAYGVVPSLHLVA